MTAEAAQPTIQQQVGHLLVSLDGRGVSLPRLYEMLPSLTSVQVRGALKSLVSSGAAIRHGSQKSPVYQCVMRPGSWSIKPDPAPKKPRMEAKQPPERVHWPEGLQIQVSPTSGRTVPFSGVDWSQSMLHPGCQDHLLVPSRRGDVRVTHRGPMGICGARKRREGNA